MKLRVHPVGLVLLGILSVQLGAGIAKTLFGEVSPTTLTWIRLTTSAILVTAIVRPVLRGRSREDWQAAGAFGLSLAVMNWAFYQALDRIPLGLAVTFEFVGPLTLAIVLSRRRSDLAWAALAGAGVALLGIRGGSLDLGGVLLALVAGAAWAAYILLSSQTGRRWEGLSGLAVASTVAAFALTPLTFAAHLGELGSSHVLLIGALVGVLSSVVPYAFELVALRTLAPAVLSILLSLEPAAATLAGLVVLGERLSAVEVLAIACVVVASVGATSSLKRAAPSQIRETPLA